MDFCIYHSKDLDGLTSAAVIYAHQKTFGELVNLFPFDYGEKLDTRKFKGKVTVMIDVSMDMDRMELLGTSALEFIWIDHHVSALEKLKAYCFEKEYEIKTTPLSNFITSYEVKKMNMIFYYSDTLSAAEIASSFYAKNIGMKGKTVIGLIGQYDTWRKEEDKKLLKDEDWEKTVLPIQFGMRQFGTPEEIYKVLIDLDYWESNMNLDTILSQGKSILKYQKLMYEKLMIENSFEFEFNNLKVLAVNSPGISSLAFDGFYFPEVHDLMMVFSYSGKKGKWIVSMYTTKDDVDILSIAKDFNGGGHQKACGFTIEHSELFFEFKNQISFGRTMVLDINCLPQDFDFKNFKERLLEMAKVPHSLYPAKELKNPEIKQITDNKELSKTNKPKPSTKPKPKNNNKNK